MGRLLLFLLSLSLVAAIETTQCVTPALAMGKQAQTYNETYAKTNPFICYQSTYGFERYGGSYKVLETNALMVTCPAKYEAAYLFDRNLAGAGWKASTADGSSPYVIFQTNYLFPTALGVWTYGDSRHDLTESTLEYADTATGPWTLLVRGTTKSLGGDNAQPVKIDYDPLIGWKQFWRFTLVKPSKTQIWLREIAFFVQPYSELRDTAELGDIRVPGPFYTASRNFFDPSRNTPYAYTTLDTSFTFSLLVYLRRHNVRHVNGFRFETTSSSAGVATATVRRYLAQNDSVEGKVLCQFAAKGRVQSGQCLWKSDITDASLFVFAASPFAASPPTPIANLEVPPLSYGIPTSTPIPLPPPPTPASTKTAAGLNSGLSNAKLLIPQIQVSKFAAVVCEEWDCACEYKTVGGVEVIFCSGTAVCKYGEGGTLARKF